MGLLVFFTALAVALGGGGAAAATTADDSLVSCLRSSLSPEASVYLPGDGGYANDTIRWNRYHQPTFTVVAAVANEHDVRASVRIRAHTQAIAGLALANQRLLGRLPVPPRTERPFSLPVRVTASPAVGKR